jgi:hypothetical protein
MLKPPNVPIMLPHLHVASTAIELRATLRRTFLAYSGWLLPRNNTAR